MVDKDALRRAFRRARMEMPEADWQRESSILRERLAQHAAVAAARDIHVFWPLVLLREPDLRPVIDRWIREGRRVWLPVVDGDTLTAGRYTGPESLHAAPRGLLEPLAQPDFQAHALDVVIVPALAADRAGFRLGYGAGYYDRWLAGVHAETVCPIFGTGFVDALPREAHDIPVHHIITSA